MTITISGPQGCGKSTTAMAIAKFLGGSVLDWSGSIGDDVYEVYAVLAPYQKEKQHIRIVTVQESE